LLKKIRISDLHFAIVFPHFSCFGHGTDVSELMYNYAVSSENQHPTLYLIYDDVNALDLFEGPLEVSSSNPSRGNQIL